MWGAVLGRDGRLFIHELGTALVLTAVLALLGALAIWSARQAGSESSFTPAKVALVDEEGGILSKIAINLISGQEFVSSVLSVETVTEQQAMDGMDQGVWAAVVILPEGYYDDICHGVPVVSSIILCQDEPVYSEILRLLAQLGEKLVAAGQFGVFSGQQALWDAGQSALMEPYLTRINGAYVSEAFNAADQYFVHVDVGYEGSSLSLVSYYALVYLAFVLELCSLFFTGLITQDRTKAMLIRYRCCGVSEGQFLSGKILFPFLFRTLLFLGMTAVLCRWLDCSATPGACLTAAAGMLFLSVLGASVLTVLSGREAGMAVISVLAATGLFLKGGVVPLSMFPEALKAVGSYTPLGIVFSCLSTLFGGSVSMLQWIVMLLTAAACLLAARFSLRACVLGRGTAE